MNPQLGGASGDRDEIIASSQVVVDGDLSKAKLSALIGEKDALLIIF